jgi:hypothetical protein
MYLVRIPNVPLPEGWSQPSTEIRFVVPNGYPYAAPDCFWADMALRLRGGAMPKNATVGQMMPGQTDTQNELVRTPGEVSEAFRSIVSFLTARLVPEAISLQAKIAEV